MKHIIYVFLFLISLSFISCEKEVEILEKDKDTQFNAEHNNRIVEGIIRVKLAPEIVEKFTATKSDIITKSGDDAIDAYLHVIGAKSMKRVFSYHPIYEERLRESGLHLWYDIEFDNTKPATKVANNLNNLKGVTIVEKIYNIPTCNAIGRSVSNPLLETPEEFIPTVVTKAVSTKATTYSNWKDPELNKQWHYYNDGSFYGATPGADINLFEAWDITTGDPSIIVAVIDDGVDGSHPDLVANMWNDGNGHFGKNFTDGSYNITPSLHGTHVAGTVAATNNNDIGVCGVAGGNGKKDSGVKIMSCQIMSKDGIPTNKIAEAFTYAAHNGALICQCSWELGDTDNSNFSSVKEAIKYFIENAGCDPTTKLQKDSSKMKGGIVIFAAGNRGTEAKSYPPAYESVIAVANMGSKFQLFSNSNRGDWVDIWAPGGGIYSTINGNKYQSITGTSMAAPHVSGVAALIIAKYGQKGFTCEQLKTKLLASTSPYNQFYYKGTQYEGKCGVGILDAVAAVRENQNKKPDKVSEASTIRKDKDIHVEWKTVYDEDDKYAFLYNFYYSPDKELTKDNYQTVTHSPILANRFEAGQFITAKIVKDFNATKRYSFAIVAQDRWGTLSDPFFIKEPDNYPPLLTVNGSKDIKINGKETVTVKISVKDPENHKWDFKINGNSEIVSASKTENEIELNFSAKQTKGKYSVSIVVTDEKGASSSETFNVEITDGTPFNPEITLSVIKQIEDITLVVNESKEINLNDYFTDKNNSKITYSALSNNNDIAKATIKDNVITVNAIAKGGCSITITAQNENNQTVNSSFNINVKEKDEGTSGDFNELIKLTSANPANSTLSFKVNPNVSNCSLCIYNAKGKVLLNKKLSFIKESDRDVSLNISNLSSGVYSIKVEANGKSCIKNFIKL